MGLVGLLEDLVHLVQVAVLREEVVATGVPVKVESPLARKLELSGNCMSDGYSGAGM